VEELGIHSEPAPKFTHSSNGQGVPPVSQMDQTDKYLNLAVHNVGKETAAQQKGK